MHRVFHAVPLSDDAEFTLADGAARHLLKVLRLRAGDGFVAFDGSGREWPATLLDPRAGTARSGSGEAVDRESPLDLTLVQGISRGERMDWTIQKAVELGVRRIVPVLAARSTVQLRGERGERRLEHWRGVVVAACEQSGRNRVPAVDAPLALAQWLAQPRPPALVLDPAASAGLRSVGGLAPRFTLLVGPEGGFDADELAAARAAGCTPVRAGPRVLRTETAGVAALAALQALYGDL